MTAGMIAFTTALLASGVRLTVPILVTALGELVSERAGVINLGLEGMMISGSLAAFALAGLSGNLILGILGGVVAGTVMGMVMVLVAVRRRSNQLVTGFAITVFGLGITSFLYAQYGETLPPIVTLPELRVPVLAALPIIGGGLFDQNVLAYASLGLTVVVALMLRRTRFGLQVLATGNDPAAAAAKGVRVGRVQTAATLFAAACAGLGGAAMSLGSVGNFGPNMTAGRGFVAIAVVILGRWKPSWTLLGALIFGLADSLQLRLQDLVRVPTDLLPGLPWVVVVGLLIVGSRWTHMPKALGQDLALEE